VSGAARAAAEPVWGIEQGRLSLSGDWLAQSGDIPAFPGDALSKAGVAGSLVLDISGVGKWDSGLVQFLWEANRAAAKAGIESDASKLPDSARKLLGLLSNAPPEPAAPAPPRSGLLGWIGAGTISVFEEAGILSTLLGTTARGGFLAVFGRARLRAVDLWANIRDAGPRALVIVSVVNFLIGAILAFVGAAQLRKFAAGLYVANLVGLALVREMVPVMTAIVMAGRTGGAYAARIATMQGNEEIDALKVIGIPVSDYILLPSILALIFTMPMLYLYGCLVGIFGGMVVATGMLNISAISFLNQVLQSVPLDQFVFGFGKSIAFAILIGVTSCRIGLKAGRSAADVGSAATSAVVVGIVGVIAMDAVFAVFADMMGI
jgi:phospholipid/cholesterol/gamma-HCH transport system permease protein